jgi:hypothetical protein
VTAEATRPNARRRWLIGAAGLGLAASVAVVVGTAAMLLRPANPPPVATGPRPLPELPKMSTPHASAGKAGLVSLTQPAAAAVNSAPQFQKVNEVLSRYAQVEGLIVIDDHTPARIVREVAVERTEWFDERRGLTIKAVVPRENVKLIALETH